MNTKNERAHYRLPFMILLFIILLTITGIPPFLGFFLKLVILNQIIILRATLALALVTLSLLIIAAYLRIIFSLLTLINSSSLNLIGRASEKTLTFEFILLNRTFRVLFLNYSICNILHK